MAATFQPNVYSGSRRLVAGVIITALAIVHHGQATAQGNVVKASNTSSRIGFRSYIDSTMGIYKTGLWEPVYVNLVADGTGRLALPVEQGGIPRGKLAIDCNDGDGVQSRYTVDWTLPDNGSTTIQGYVKPGPNTFETKFILKTKERDYTLGADNSKFINGGHYLYLTLGGRTQELFDALVDLGGNKQNKETEPRHAAFETDVQLLPRDWFGYDGVDMIILHTSNRKFLEQLLQESDQMTALMEWVRQGGRLVIPIAWQNQDLVHSFLKSPRWQPPLPAVLPADKVVTHDSLPRIQGWAGIGNKPFPPPGSGPVQVPQFTPTKTTEVLLWSNDKEALIVRLPYGRGQITLMGIALDAAPFTAWQGRMEFWKSLLEQLGPRVLNQPMDPNGMGFMGREVYGDLSSQMHVQLDQFNVPMISFGWVALFILLYIVIVGPVDYLILKKVFKRLEWTWITFPAVVLIISVAAYFTAYALKGKDRKVNKVDLVDIDLRTAVNDKGETTAAYAYGTTWFTVLSPRIQNYDVTIKPALNVWTGVKEVDPDNREPVVSWFGRMEYGRMRSQGLFQRTYDYAPDASALEGVPIPVWTSKAFLAYWDGRFDKMPLTVDLKFDPDDPNQRVTGTITNHLPVPIEDVAIIYENKFYRIPNLPAGGPDTVPIEPKLTWENAGDIERWQTSVGSVAPQPAFRSDGTARFDPLPVLRGMYFFDRVLQAGGQNNGMFRRLDQSWRLRRAKTQEAGVRTAFLVGRLPRKEGSAEQLTADGDPHLPTQLWLGSFSKDGTRPTLEGTISQETAIRVIFPIRPIEK